jgi:hypothetical protein
MSGGITQLVAVGAQDTHLVGNPEVSFFQSSYKRHSNFSSVIERQVIQNTPANNGLSSIRFERKGDLLSYVYLVNDQSSTITEVNWANIIDKVELYIGGQLIDTQHFEYSADIHTDIMANAFSKGVFGSAPDGTDNLGFFYPFKFWFCENWQSALPLIALQYHDVEMRIYWADNVAVTTGTMEAWARYIYLDTDERRMMAEKPMDMLIHQVQRIPGSGAKTMDLTFNHPVKFIASTDGNFDASDDVLLQLNGVDVGDKKPAKPHYNHVSAYYHTQFGANNTDGAEGFQSVTLMIPFCLDASKLQPTGTCNFSRMDSATLRLYGSNTISSPVYAVNYNILRVQNGMGGLLYAN